MTTAIQISRHFHVLSENDTWTFDVHTCECGSLPRVRITAAPDGRMVTELRCPNCKRSLAVVSETADDEEDAFAKAADVWNGGAE